MKQAEDTLDLCKAQFTNLYTAESCTGGLLAGLLTEISGASDVFQGAVVSYSNVLKSELLGVPNSLLERKGAVSHEVAEAMARGLIERVAHSHSSGLGISVTGIAGPTGGSKDKPVGLVYIGCATTKAWAVRKFNFAGNRQEIRFQAIEQSLRFIQETI